MYYTQSRSLNLDFNSPADVGKYGLTLIGDAYIDKRGLFASDTPNAYAQSPLLGTEWDSDALTVIIKFTPKFDTEEGVTRPIFATTGGGGGYLYIDTAGTLRFTISGVTVAGIVKSTYAAYWKVNEKNTIILTTISGKSNLWLNGVRISTDTVAAWTKAQATGMNWGTNTVTSGRFDGWIHGLEVHKSEWNVEDVAAYHNNSLMSFKNQAITWLDCRSERLDGSDRYLNDESGHGNNYVMTGDPEFQNPVGYKLDTNDSFNNTSPSAAYTDLEEYSVAIQTRPLFPLNEAANNHLWGEDGTTSSIYRSSSAARLRFHFIATVIAFWTPAELAGIWNDKSTNIIICSYKSGKNNIIINGHHKLVDGTVTFATPFTMTNLSLCAQAATGLYSWDGTTYHMSDYPFALSPLQMQQLTSDLLTNTH